MCTTCGCSSEEHTVLGADHDRDASYAQSHSHGQTHAHPHSLDGDHAYSHFPDGYGNRHSHDRVRSRDDADAHTDTDHTHSHEDGDAHFYAATASALAHSHEMPSGKLVTLEQELLTKNQRLAERNRGWFAGRDIIAINLLSAPGSGKTTLLERTVRALAAECTISVIEGDQATAHDAERIRGAGCRAVQINTGRGCHLDAAMVASALERLAPPPGSLLFIENVGNLICPALFDLGERAKVVIVSVTEGEDKPLKYPHMFLASQLMLVNKLDLLPYVRFDLGRCIAHARQINPGIRAFAVSAQNGEGMDEWYGWLREQMQSSARQHLGKAL